MSPKEAIHNLIEIVSKGGNYLLNVGPDGTGVIIPEAVDILREMGTWLDRYGESIYGADGLPMIPPENVLLTVKPHRLFVHVLDWNNQNVQIGNLDLIVGKWLDKVKKVYLLGDPEKKPLNYQLADGVLTIDLSSCRIPKTELNKHAEVLVVSDGN